MQRRLGHYPSSNSSLASISSPDPHSRTCRFGSFDSEVLPVVGSASGGMIPFFRRTSSLESCSCNSYADHDHHDHEEDEEEDVEHQHHEEYEKYINEDGVMNDDLNPLDRCMVTSPRRPQTIQEEDITTTTTTNTTTITNTRMAHIGRTHSMPLPSSSSSSSSSSSASTSTSDSTLPPPGLHPNLGQSISWTPGIGPNPTQPYVTIEPMRTSTTTMTTTIEFQHVDDLMIHTPIPSVLPSPSDSPYASAIPLSDRAPPPSRNPSLIRQTGVYLESTSRCLSMPIGASRDRYHLQLQREVQQREREHQAQINGNTPTDALLLPPQHDADDDQLPPL